MSLYRCPRFKRSVFWTGTPREEALFKPVVTMSALVLLGVVVACSGTDAASDGSDVAISPIPASATTIPVAQTQPPASPTVPSTPATSALTGFSFPLAGGCLPKGDQLMPNAPRPYRKGIHEGVDFYEVDNCTRITKGTEVLAAKPGRVVRADLDYHDLTPSTLAQYSANPNTEEALDAFRGRQVWVQHEGGVITRYAHLSGIAAGLSAGTTVSRGQVVAYVGESGTPESVTNPGHEYHLHFEVRIGEGYLGRDLPSTDVRRLYQQLFAQPQ